MKKRSIHSTLVSACSVVALTATAANAQIDEVIVTAQKREQNILDIPVSVSAFSGDQIEKSGVANIFEVGQLTPSVSFTTSNSSTNGATIRLRGLGTTAQNPGFEPGVAMFVDNVSAPRAGIIANDLVDIERVEILRGPQGTLYGRNSSFGTINIITRKPEFEFGGVGEIGYGNFNAFNVRGSVTGPVVGDKLALRLTGGYKNADGYLDDITQGDETVNDRNRYTLRGQGLFEGDNVSVRFIADYGSFDENCCAAITTNLDDGAGGWGPRSAALALGRQVPSTNINDLEVNITDDIPQFTKLETYGGSVEVNAEIGENLNLVSITSYRSFESDGQRGDAVALDIQRQTEELLESTTFTQELRLEGRNEFGPVGLNWLAGTFLISDQLDYAFGLQTGEDFEEFIRFVAGAPVGGALTLEAITGNTTAELASELAAGQGSSDNYSQDTLGLGLFGHTEIDLPAGFGVTLGLRWSRDEKDGRGDIDGYEVTGGNTLGDFCSTFQGDYTAALAGAPFFLPPPAAGGLGFLANLNACFPAFLAGNGFGFPDYAGELNEEEITGDAKISWSIDDVVPGVESLLLYGSYSRGFKSGGFNLDHSAAVSDPTFDKEVVNAYEIGVKTSVLGGRGVIKAAWFYNDVENFQQLAFNGSAFTVFNVPRVVNRGAEVEIQASPLDGLHVNFALQYNDAFYPANQEVDPVVANLPGRDLVHAPEFVYVAGVGYGNEIPGTGLSAFARADYRYETDHFTTSAPGSFVENRQTVNARVGLGGPDGLWTVEFWGKNIFNDITERLIIPAFGQPANFASGNSAAWIDPPRTFGGTVRGRF